MNRRLGLLAAGVALLLVLGVMIGANLGDPGEAAPAPSPSPSQVDKPSPVATEDSYSPDAGDEQHDQGPPETQESAWAPAVDNFARNFTNTAGGAKKWRQRLIGNHTQPYVTADVAKQLATVDVRNVPDGHYENRELVKSSDYEIGVKVNYREGWAMVLYLITDGTGWQIYAYDKWED